MFSKSTATSTDYTRRLDSIKNIDQTLLKFQNSNNSKSNILRLNLLPYLRYPITPFSDINELVSTSLIDLNIDLLYLEAKSLLDWWSELLKSLSGDYPSIPINDRNCYYESISRLISLNIWHLFQINMTYSNQFNDIYTNYQKCVLKTFELSILRLNSKSVSLSITVFTGKLFAYSFFNLPDISKGILFLLNTKLVNFRKILKISITDDISNVLSDLSSQLPSHLSELIYSINKPRVVNYKIELQFLNSILPPREKINGINDTKGVWVSKWSSLENIQLFCSFFRNYLIISANYLRNFPMLMLNENCNYIYLLPGYLNILTHIYEIFTFQINSIIIKLRNKPSKFRNTSISMDDNLLFIHPKISTESNIDKLFNILRDFLINPRSTNEKLLKNGIIKSYENVIKLFISKTSILDNIMINVLFDLFIQFLKNIDESTNNYLIIDWNFWLNTLVLLLDSNNLTNQTKAFSILYEIWELIPVQVEAGNFPWISKPLDTLKLNLIEYILNDSNWFKFFGNYNSLLRNLYIKLIIWKILGIYSIYSDCSFNESINQLKVKKLINNQLLKTFELTSDIICQPVDPIINKHFKIFKINKRSNDKKLRTYPFEILDDSVYSNSGVTNIAKSKSNDSLSKNSKNSNNSKWMNKIFNKSSSSSSLPLLSSSSSSLPSSSLSSQNNKNKVFGKLLKLSLSKEDTPTPATTAPLTSGSTSTVNSSVSSLSSSLSSLELIIESKSTNSCNPNINKSTPPEWNHNFEVVNNELYEFKLVNNKLKMQLFLNNLNSLNSKERKFIDDIDNILIQNDEPKLPEINIHHDDLSNFASVEDLTNDSINIDLGMELNDFDLTNDFLHSKYVTGKKLKNVKMSQNTKSELIYLSNGIFEFNEDVKVFENFLIENIKKIKMTNTNANGEDENGDEDEDDEEFIVSAKVGKANNLHDDLNYLNDSINDLDILSDKTYHEPNFSFSSSSLIDKINDLTSNHNNNELKLSKLEFKNLLKVIPRLVTDLSDDRINGY